jgi:hypothetical protein
VAARSKAEEKVSVVLDLLVEAALFSGNGFPGGGKREVVESF